MNNDDNNPIVIGSILEVKASGIDVSNDLLLNEGKSIAELLNDQKEKTNRE
jgi:hypothetical protein